MKIGARAEFGRTVERQEKQSRSIIGGIDPADETDQSTLSEARIALTGERPSLPA